MSQATSQPNIIIASNRNIRSIHSADDCRQWQSFPPSISAKSSSSYLRAISEYDRAMLRNDDPVAFNEEDRHPASTKIFETCVFESKLLFGSC